MDYNELDKLIDELKTMIDIVVGKGLYGIFATIGSSSYTWADVWKKAAEVQNGFDSGVQYPTKEQRDQAWQRFNSLRDEASKRSKSDSDSRRWRSQSLKSDILKKVDSAKPGIFF